MSIRTCILTAGLLLAGSFGSSAKAGFVLFNIDVDPAGWAAAVSGMTPSTAYNFGLDPDYGISGFNSPLTTAGNAVVSPGIVAPGVVFTDLFGTGVPELIGVGPGAGFGNTTNAVIANFFADGLLITTAPATGAFDFFALSLLGGNTVDLTVNGTDVFAGLIAPAAGTHYGILATGGDMISSVSFFDTAVGGGAEGVQGLGTFYAPADNGAVPVPPSMAFFGLGALGLIARRFRKA